MRKCVNPDGSVPQILPSELQSLPRAARRSLGQPSASSGGRLAHAVTATRSSRATLTRPMIAPKPGYFFAVIPISRTRLSAPSSVSMVQIMYRASTWIVRVVVPSKTASDARPSLLPSNASPTR